MITVQRERFVDIQEELPQLFAVQYDEVITDKDGLKDNVDYATYRRLEELNTLYCLTARSDKKLVGYFFLMVTFHLHHTGLKTASSDMIFVHPDYRKGTGAGARILRKGIQDMQNLGVRKLYIGAKTGTGLATILERMKFRHIEDIFSLRLGE